MTYATAFQIHVLWLHYKPDQIFHMGVSYMILGKQLLNEIGIGKLELAIQVVPNDSSLSYQEAAVSLPILDAWFQHPECVT